MLIGDITYDEATLNSLGADLLEDRQEFYMSSSHPAQVRALFNEVSSEEDIPGAIEKARESGVLGKTFDELIEEDEPEKKDLNAVES